MSFNMRFIFIFYAHCEVRMHQKLIRTDIRNGRKLDVLPYRISIC